jgi:uncharacterized membrane protein
MIYTSLTKKSISVDLTLQQWLLLSCGFSCLLLGTRVVVTGEFTYLFLTWNLFLAFIPLAITQWLGTNDRFAKSKMTTALVLLIWLLFIPNSFYILTDLFHLHKFDAAPKWFDLLLLFSFAWNGILLGVVSLRRTAVMLERFTHRNFSPFMVFIVMWLNAFGIYIGRYLRFNSWDIITKPFSVFNGMFDVLLHPVRNKMEWGMIAVYAVFMTVLYITIKKLAENFQHLTTK